MDFELKYIPKRSDKPRKEGLTMMMDKGMGVRQLEEVLEASGHLIDIVKLGFGTSMVSKNVKEKVKMCREANIEVYLGGTLFEAFMVRDQFEDYLRLLDHLDIRMAEVSDGSIVIEHDIKCDYISRIAKDRTVLSEVGSKEAGIIIHPNKWISMMKTELEAGSWKVIAEARESGNVGIFRSNGTAHTMLVNKILNQIDPNAIIWEAPKKPQQVWFIKLLGANVNLGNIAPNEVIPLETLRLGLRGDTFFEFLPAEISEKIKPQLIEEDNDD